MELAELKLFIREKEQEGKICLMTCEGLMICDLNAFINQPAKGILYDLNRDRATTLTLASEEDVRWINDYAVAVVITKLKEELDVKSKECESL